MLKDKIYKFLYKSCRLICHQKKERCFIIGNHYMPICARCTGILTSFILVIILLKNNIYINFKLAIIMIMIMFLDWLLQYLKIKESTNSRRLLTGIIGGFGLSYFYYYIINYFLNFLG